MLRKRLRKAALWISWKAHANACAAVLHEMDNMPRGRPRKARAEAPALPEAETESLQAAAVRWGVSEDTLRRDIDEGVIKSTTIRGRRVVFIADCRRAYAPR